MRVLEHMVKRLISQRVEIDEIQCGFMSGRGPTNAIFIVYTSATVEAVNW